MIWTQGVAETSSKVLGEAGPWVETGDLLSSSLDREGEGEAGGGAPSEETKSYKDEGKDKATDRDNDKDNDKGKDENRCIVNFVSKARSKEIRLRLDEERKERIAKRFLTFFLSL